jgi:hypothetical protein
MAPPAGGAFALLAARRGRSFVLAAHSPGHPLHTFDGG